jgi:hypothetical protein
MQGDGMGDMDAFGARLDTIEKEVRRIADSLSLLIRVDERLLAVQSKQDDYEARLRALEVASGSAKHSLSFMQWFGGILAAALLAFGLNMAKDGINRPAISLPAPSQPVPEQPRVH